MEEEEKENGGAVATSLNYNASPLLFPGAKESSNIATMAASLVLPPATLSQEPCMIIFSPVIYKNQSFIFLQAIQVNSPNSTNQFMPLPSVNCINGFDIAEPMFVNPVSNSLNYGFRPSWECVDRVQLSTRLHVGSVLCQRLSAETDCRKSNFISSKTYNIEWILSRVNWKAHKGTWGFYFIEDLLYEAAVKSALDLVIHEEGCINFKNFIISSRGQLLQLITESSVFLSQDPFGNFAVQHVLELEIPTFTKEICSAERPLCEDFNAESWEPCGGEMLDVSRDGTCGSRFH
ncbi:hypothetical protein SLEP1_g29111 [Rubroshorea leprosula]|uniref:Uncharacterized protein n=1 Tax=Rubroshorea leprosula TaxID=152421 RepID=A0AAV5JVU4_9ROSI|nr:hypothetical protein SLEP1_g29111 [Rubroshorea leprosula]